MFRQKPKQLTKEVEFPINLKGLGYFINEKDIIRQIVNPEEPFNYYVHGKTSKWTSAAERLNLRHREAIDECCRRIVIARLEKHDIHPLNLPDIKDPSERHVKILASKNLADATKILLIVPDPQRSGLGIFSMREMIDDGIFRGSMQQACEMAIKYVGYNAIVIANPAVLKWDIHSKTAMSHVSYTARDRTLHETNAVSDMKMFTIPGHSSPEEHIASVFDYLKSTIRKDARLDFLGVQFSAFLLLRYLGKEFEYWQHHVHAGIFALSPHYISDLPHGAFRHFVRERCRNYVPDHETEKGKRMLPDMNKGCPIYSGGNNWLTLILLDVLQEMMDFLKAGWEAGDSEFSWEALNPDGTPDQIKEAMNIAPEEDPNTRFADAQLVDLSKCDLADPNPGWEVPGMETIRRLAEEAGINRAIVEKARKDEENARIAARYDKQARYEELEELTAAVADSSLDCEALSRK